MAESQITPERAAVLEALRPGEYQELSGRPSTSLRQMQGTYGIPFAANPVNLRVVLRGMHELLARHYHQFRQVKDTGRPSLSDPEADLENPDAPQSPALEEMRRHKAALLKLELEQKRGELVLKADVDAMVSRMAAVTRKMTDQLRKAYNDGVVDIVDAALEDLRREAAGFGEQHE